MPIELRHYQKNQLNFIDRKMKTGLGVAIKSPTGSGKSYVILQYIKDLLNKHKGENFTIVVATGFNNLVYQLEEDAPKFGFKPIVWVGQQHIVSEKKLKAKIGSNNTLNINEYQAFTKDESMRASLKERCVARTCRVKKETGDMCLYHQARTALKGLNPKVIFTNHTSYLLGLKYNSFSPDIAIIDESHVFASYYESMNTETIAPHEIKYIQSKLDSSDPTFMLFKKAIEKGLMISPQIFTQVQNKLKAEKMEKASIIARKLQYFSMIKPSIDKYLEVSSDVGMQVTNFWSKFDVKQENIDYLLFSATQDTFTLDMFQIPRQNLYIENDCHTIDYSESKLLIYKESDYSTAASKFLKRMNKEGNIKGLMLSTTNKDIRYLKELGALEGYKITTSKEEFERCVNHKIVLAGSRVLFQGVDIQGLDFVSLNKIPFPTYDEKFQALSTYLENIADKDPWSQYTVPKVQNDLTQSTGRLWRNPGDKGTIAVFDERLDGKFSYFIKSIQRERAGIKIEIIEKID